MVQRSPSSIPGGETFRWLHELERSATSASSSISALDSGKAAVGQTAFMTFLFESPDDKDYRVLVNSPIAFTIDSITTISASGTCTLTGKINTTALGGTANSVSTSEQEQTHSSANSVSVGDDVVLTVSSNSSADSVSVTIKCTLTLGSA